jgi:hypothetical protein
MKIKKISRGGVHRGVLRKRSIGGVIDFTPRLKEIFFPEVEGKKGGFFYA